VSDQLPAPRSGGGGSLGPLRPLGLVAGGLAGLVVLGDALPVASVEAAIVTAFSRWATILGVLGVAVAPVIALVGGLMWVSPHGHHRALGRDLLIGSVVVLVVGSATVTAMHFASGVMTAILADLNAAPH